MAEHKEGVKKAGIALLVYILANLLAIGLWEIQVRTENIMMIYLISIIIMMIEVRRYVWGFIYTIICIVTFNFLFTSPRFTLRVDDPNYILTMFIFLTVSIITGFLVNGLSKQAKLSKENEDRMKSLLEINSGYLTLSGINNIAYYGIKCMYQVAGERCIAYIAKSPSELQPPYYIKNQVAQELLDNDTPANWCFINNTVCGANSGFFGESKWVYLPIKSGNKCLGVFGVFTNGNEIDDNHMAYINTILTDMAMAIEKEGIYQKQYANKSEEEKAKLLLTMNRDIYQNFQTPLHDITEGIKDLLKKEEEIPGPEDKKLLAEIFIKVRTLAGHVDNKVKAYHMTEGNLQVHLKPVAYQDIVNEAYSMFDESVGSRRVMLNMPAEPIIVKADKDMMVRAVSNVLDNALSYTPEDAEIRITLTSEQGYGHLSICDSGGGISPKVIKESFIKENIYDIDEESKGLRVSRAIIEMNGGKVLIKSNDVAGASISILLQLLQFTPKG